MRTLALTRKKAVDLGGVEARIASELEQFGPLLKDWLDLGERPPGFQDLGEVSYEGVEYYASAWEVR